MFPNLALGSLVISLTVLIHTFGLIVVTNVMSHLVAGFKMEGRRSRILAKVTIVFGILVLLTLEVWLWAGSFFLLGLFDDFATALYFSTTTFSTLGYGDVVPNEEWRIFAAMEGVNGFLLIGRSTAYLITAGTRIGPFHAGEHF